MHLIWLSFEFVDAIFPVYPFCPLNINGDRNCSSVHRNGAPSQSSFAIELQRLRNRICVYFTVRQDFFKVSDRNSFTVGRTLVFFR